MTLNLACYQGRMTTQ